MITGKTKDCFRSDNRRVWVRVGAYYFNKEGDE